MNRIKSYKWFKVICFVLITTFIPLNASWSYSPTNTTAKVSTLATPCLFQPEMPGEASAQYRNSIFSDMRLCSSLFVIAKNLLVGNPSNNIPPVPLRRLAAVLHDEHMPIVEGIDIDHVSLKDDNTVVISYNRHGKVLYEIQIALKDSVTLPSSGWVIAEQYAIRARFVKRLYDLTKPVDITSTVDIERAVSAELDLREETSNDELFNLTISFVPASMQNLQGALKELGSLPEGAGISIEEAQAKIDVVKIRHGLNDAEARILWVAWMGPAEGIGDITAPGTGQRSNSIEEGVPGVYLEGSYSHEEDVRRSQETAETHEEAQILAAHAALRAAVDDQRLHFIGQESGQTIQSLMQYANRMVDNGDNHVIFIGKNIDASAPFLLQALTAHEDWNIHARKEGRPQVHFMTEFDSRIVSDLLKRSHEAREDKVRIVYVGESSARSTEFLAEIERQYGITAENADTNIVTANTIGLLAAGIVTDSSTIEQIYHGAAKRHQEWLALYDASALTNHDAYKLAAAEIRMAKTGQNVSVFMIFSMRLRYLSIYLAQLYNKAIGNAGLDVWFSGENLTYLHSTQQAHKQAVPFPHNDQLRERARRGFISLAFLNPQEEGDVAVSGPTHPMLRGFGFRFLIKITRAAYRLSMRLSHRPIVEVNFEARNPEDLGRLLHFAQVSSAMAGQLAGNDPVKDAGIELEKSVDARITNIPIESHADGTLTREQNILRFSERDGNVVLSGILGNELEAQAVRGEGESDLLKQVLAVINRLPKKLESKVITPYRSGAELEHLNPEKIQEEAKASAGMAELFKKKKRIYAVSIGGSTTGPLMANALGLTEGPEIIEVQSYDADVIARIKKDIEECKDPGEIGVVIISKSGVTTEIDVNGWTIIDELTSAFQRIAGNADEVKNHVLIVTDPQVGTLCKKAKNEGWRLLSHPVLIGGRWSMFSSVGLFYYFLKGGKAEDLESAVRKLDAQNKGQSWDAHLAEILKKIGGYKESLDPKKNVPWNERKKTLRDAALLLSEIPGVWEGVLDYLVNTIPALDRDTEIALALDRSYESLVSHTHPFGPQLRAESKSKPGIQFYSVALWGWNAIRDAWSRIISDRRAYVTLYGIAAPQDQAGSYGARLEKASWDAVMEELDARHQPYMAVRTSSMSTANLLNLMHYQYLRLAVDMALYEPMDHKSENQPGVEETKNIVRAVLANVASNIMELFTGEPERARKRLDGIPIPEIQADQIEHMTEVPMNLRESLGMEEDLTKLIEDFIRGRDAQHHGILSQSTLEEIKKRPNNEIPSYLHQLLSRHFRSMPNILGIYLDDEKPTVSAVPDARWIIRATSLENWANLEHGTANGSNIGIYEYEEGRLVLRASIQILWGSSVRATISNGIKTQDFKLKGDGKRIVEIDRPGEDNSVIMGQKGTYIAFGGISKDRPVGFQRFENEILRPSLNTSIRFSDSLSADTSLMMNKQGLLAEWMTRAEAFELAQIMQTASGCVMTMTEEGLKRVSDLAISEKDLEDKTQIYVYAGTPDQVRQVEVFLNYLSPLNGEVKAARSLVLDTLEVFQSIPKESPAALRAAAIMWTLRLKQGLSALPPVKGLKGDIKQTVSQALDEIENTLTRLDLEVTLEELKGDYLRLTPDARRQEAAKYVLLGHPRAGMAHNTRIEAGEAMKLIYELSNQFERASAWALLENARLTAQVEGYNTAARNIEDIQAYLQKSYKVDDKISEKPKDQLSQSRSFGESLDKYIKDAAGVPEMVRQTLGLRDAKLPESACNVLNRMVDVYLNDQELGDVSDSRVKKLQETLSDENEIFYARDGKVWVHNLHWIRQNIEERKSGAIVNQTGDVSSRLDNIYNYVLIYFAQPLVDTIISEEESDPVKGFQKVDPNEPSLIIFIDPIDGSSQIKEAGTFGMIFTIGMLLPEQRLSDFEPRKQILASMDVQFGWPRTLLRFVNRARGGRSASPETYGRPEVVQFELTQSQERTGEAFRKQSRYEPLTIMEEGVGWEGLLSLPQSGKGLGVAMGGSFIDSRSDDGHREIVGWLEDTYGYRLSYTGALVNDIGNLLRASPRIALGALHTYGPTGKHVSGRFRLTFEEWHYALMFEALNGEVSDGLQPMLDNHMTDEEPSGIMKPFYASSRWVSKLVMAWRNYAKEYLEGKGLSESGMAENFDFFLERYKVLSRDLIAHVVVYSKREGYDVMPLGDKIVRDALLGQYGNIFGLFEPEPGEGNDAHIARIYRIVSEWERQARQRAVPPAPDPTDAPPLASEMVPNNTLAAVVDAANRLVPDVSRAIKPALSETASALTGRVEQIIAQVESEGSAQSDESVADLKLLKDNLYQLEAESIATVILARARAVMRNRALPGHEKEMVIIGLETDWIPTMKDRGYGTQHDAMDPLIVRLRSIKDALGSEQLEGVVEFIHTDADKLADALLTLASQTGTPLANIIALGSVSTLRSSGFEPLRSTPGEQRAFLAEISNANILQWYKDHATEAKRGMLPDIDLMRILSIAFEVSQGKEPPPGILWDRNSRTIIFDPEPIKVIDYNELRQRNEARAAALLSA